MKNIMIFVTGLAGAGKSSAIEVAQQFCFDFCNLMDIIWGKKHFYLVQLDVKQQYLDG